MEGADPEEADATEPEEAPAPVAGFTMEKATAELSSPKRRRWQTAILESTQDEAYVESNRCFIWKQQAEIDTLFDEVKVEMEAAAKPELRLSRMYPEPGTEIMDISDDNE